jgi:hypothetical protein
MKKTMTGLAAAVAALVVAGSAAAQVCAGFPTTDGQGTIGALVNFPTGLDQYGAEASYNFAGPLAVDAGFLRSNGGEDHLSTFRGGVALELPAFAGNFRSTGSICPSVRADYTSEDDFTIWQVPIGLGVGASVPLGSSGVHLALHIIPAVVWSRVHVDAFSGFEETTIDDTNFGVRGGAALSYNRFYLGVISEWMDVPESDAVVGVRAGIRF